MRAPAYYTSHRGWHVVVVVCATLVAWLSCRDYPGGWNDASRLATVESLVGRHTLVIDDSPFAPLTLDKLYINGHFYSDKSPVPAVLLAGPYWLWQKLTGLSAADDLAGFCRLMTLASSGLAYVVAVWCIFRLGGIAGLATSPRLALTASFGLCTLAPVYAQHVNNHLPLLGVAAVLLLVLVRLAHERSALRLLALGLLAGLGYAIEPGAGLPLVLCLGLWVLWRFRAFAPAVSFAVGVLPLFALHHGINYATGGTWRPANAVAAYFDYPGSAFSAENMTGQWHHPNPLQFCVYLLSLMFGKKGFIGHDLPMFLCLPGAVWLLRRRIAELPEVLFALAWIAGTWLLYGAASNNSSGVCYSIRWFVPLLAPGYFLLILVIRERPDQFAVLLLLSASGLLLSLWMCAKGPWTGRMVPHFWIVQGVALMTWFWLARRQATLATPAHTQPETLEPDTPVPAHRVQLPGSAQGTRTHPAFAKR